MAAVGNISSLGAGSGLQLQDILDQLRAADEQATITPKQNQVTGYQAQLDEFTVVKNKLYDLKSAALDLSLSGTFLGRTVTSSDENAVTATAVDGASIQSTTITVDSLAQKSSWMSSSGMASEDTSVYVPTSVESSTGVNNLSDTVASNGGTLDITFGGSTSISVDVGPTAGVTTMTQLVDAINTAGSGSINASTFNQNGQYYLRIETATSGGTGEANRVQIANNDTDLTLSAPSGTFAYTMGDTTTSIEVPADTTLSQLATLINNDANNPGATASVIDNGSSSPYSLVLKANNTGEDNRITLSSQMPDMALSEQTGADSASLNARFSIDGISYQRQGNSSINDVIPSVLLDLQGTGAATVSVTGNNSDLQDKITQLVTSYNDVVQEVQGKVAYDKTAGKFGVLASTTLRDLPYDLQKIMTATIPADSSGKIKSMFDLGLQFNQDGTISIDKNTLSGALANDASGVQAFFLGDGDAGITGLGDSLTQRLTTLLASNGQVQAESDAAQALIDSTNQQIDAATARLNKKYDLLTTQFVQLDQFMNQMTTESSYLSSQFNSLSSGWGTGSKSSSG